MSQPNYTTTRGSDVVRYVTESGKHVAEVDLRVVDQNAPQRGIAICGVQRVTNEHGESTWTFRHLCKRGMPRVSRNAVHLKIALCAFAQNEFNSTEGA